MKWRNTFTSIVFAVPVAFIMDTFPTWLSLSIILAFCKEFITNFNRLSISLRMVRGLNQNLTSISTNSSYNTDTEKLWWVKLAKRFHRCSLRILWIPIRRCPRFWKSRWSSHDCDPGRSGTLAVDLVVWTTGHVPYVDGTGGVEVSTASLVADGTEYAVVLLAQTNNDDDAGTLDTLAPTSFRLGACDE